jgi:hypothetical protein
MLLVDLFHPVKLSNALAAHLAAQGTGALEGCRTLQDKQQRRNLSSASRSAQDSVEGGGTGTCCHAFCEHCAVRRGAQHSVCSAVSAPPVAVLQGSTATSLTQGHLC